MTFRAPALCRLTYELFSFFLRKLINVGLDSGASNPGGVDRSIVGGEEASSLMRGNYGINSSGILNAKI